VEAGRGDVPLIELRWCYANRRSRRAKCHVLLWRAVGTIATVAVAKCPRATLPLCDYHFELSQYLWIGHGAHKLAHSRRFSPKLPSSCHDAFS
jgi:hypothetical protein